MKDWRIDPTGAAAALKQALAGKKVDEVIELVRGRKWILLRVLAAMWGVTLAMAFTTIVVVRYALSV